jgi:biotin carboxylase
MRYKRLKVIVVDDYRPDVALAPALRAYGVDVVHTHSSPGAPLAVRAGFNPAWYVADFPSPAALLKNLSRLGPTEVVAVLAGSERGVTATDYIAQVLRIATANDVKRSRARRNKPRMQASLRDAGLASIDGVASASLDEILGWLRLRPRASRFPVLAKPPEASGSEDVTICNHEEGVAEAFGRILGKLNNEGVVNDQVLVQEYLPAGETEYCVNTVSRDGRHLVSEIIRVRRRLDGPIPLHDFNELLCPVADRALWDLLREYVFRVLDALGIRFGPGHSEVMIVRGRPVLLETATRLPGGIDLSAYTWGSGHSQLALVAEAYLAPENFLARVGAARRPLRMYSSCVFLISPAEGEICGQLTPADLEPVAAHLHSFRVQGTGRLPRTIDYDTSPGHAFFLSEDKADLESARKAFRALEPELYQKLISGTVKRDQP